MDLAKNLSLLVAALLLAASFGLLVVQAVTLIKVAIQVVW